MNILVFLLVVFLNSNLISSNLICNPPINLGRSSGISRFDPDDIIDIKFSPFGTQVNEVSFIGVFNINVTDSFLQLNVKTFDFELNYIEKNINKLIVCRYDIPSSGGAVMRAFDFANLNHLSEYSLSVGYTLKSGKSYKNKDNRMFTTCFGRPEPPRNIRYVFSKDCSITVEWLAPQISNSPYVCYYEVKYSDGINPSVTTNIDTTSFKFSGKASRQYNFYIQSVNSQKCYSDQILNQSCKQVNGMSGTLNFSTGTSCKSLSSKSNSKLTFSFFSMISAFVFVIFL
jgi:hypothetical protein